MKNISIILSVVSLLLIATLFYLFYSGSAKTKSVTEPVEKQAATSFRIAYFEIDSLEAHYGYFKEVLAQVNQKTNAMNVELSGMEKSYQKKIAEWQKKGTTMSQAESEQAQQEYALMQQNYQSRKQSLQEELFKQQEDLKSDIRKKIEAFLKEYNKQKNYSFIFAYESNSFMYARDTTYNITRDLVDGLNADYGKNKK
ncbi:MAG: OmpH family outer membrane protein [Bacteroidetes bacterium]|nr:OmpH family outer membrane protein [Bacteroidota bacterium]